VYVEVGVRTFVTVDVGAGRVRSTCVAVARAVGEVVSAGWTGSAVAFAVQAAKIRLQSNAGQPIDLIPFQGFVAFIIVINAQAAKS